MFSHMRLCLLVIILIAPVACKEVAYVYDEGGGHVLENVTAHNGTDVVAYTVSLGESSSSKSSKISTTGDAIKTDINRKINKLNRPIIKEGSKLIGNISGDRRIDQICSIYEYSVSNWIYKADWKGLEYFQYSNESLEYGQDVNKLGKGDCDDFSILLTALIESVGATPRIIFAYGPAGGHAFAQVYLGQDVGYDSKVSRMVDWLKSKYGVKEVYTFKDEATEDVWLNLDWWKDPKTSKDVVKHPGGPLFNATDFVYAYQDDKANWTALTPVPEPPIAKFSISNANPNAKENVTFDASESSDADTQIKAWNWDFGDGKKGSGQVVTHAYSQGGRYNVALTVTDDDEVEKSSQSNKTINVNGLPVPIINYEPKNPKKGDLIYFDGSQSYDPDIGGFIKNYYWDFGDGEDSHKIQPSYRYDSNGSYTVNLTVTDDKGAISATSVKIKANLPPIASFTYAPKDKEPNPGDIISFDASASSDPDGTIIDYEWQFDETNTARGKLVTFGYSRGGSHTVNLIVRDDNSATGAYSEVIQVNDLPVPVISYDIPEPKAEDTIIFDASGSNDVDGIKRYDWDLGDGTPGIGPYVSHKYLVCGSYEVKMTATDNKDAKNSTTTSIMIRSNPKEVFRLIHESAVYSAQFSSDGTKVLTTSYDNMARIWDAASGRELTKLLQDVPVYDAQFSSDGTKVVTVCLDNMARIWDAASGRELTKLLHEGNVNSAEFSPDGTKVATASDDNTARIWYASSGSELTKLLHEGHVKSAEFSPDGTKVATASDDNTARIWDAASGRELSKLPHEGTVYSAQFSPDGTKVVTTSHDNTARIWDAASGQELSKLPHESWVFSAQFSPDGTKVVMTSSDGTARICDASSGQELAKLPHQDTAISISAQFSPDGTKVVTRSDDNTARIWDASSGQELSRLPHQDTVISAQFSPDGTKVVTASEDKTARIWDLGKCI